LPPNLGWFLGAYFLYGLALYGASSFLSLYLKTLGAMGLAITLTFAAGVVVEVLVMRWSGRFSDRFGRRPVLAFSFLLLPLRLLLYIPAMSPWWVAGVQSLHGINFGIMGALAVVFVNDLALDSSRGSAQARLAAMGGLGTALGPPVLGWISQSWSLGAMFGVAALLAAVSAAIFLIKVQESRPAEERLEDHVPPWLKGAARWIQGPLSARQG
jgi:MFS family permease